MPKLVLRAVLDIPLFSDPPDGDGGSLLFFPAKLFASQHVVVEENDENDEERGMSEMRVGTFVRVELRMECELVNPSFFELSLMMACVFLVRFCVLLSFELPFFDTW